MTSSTASISSTALEQVGRRPEPTVAQFIGRLTPEIARALPKHLDADRITRLALTVLRTDEMAAVKRGKPQQALTRCKPESFAGALLTASALGLEPGVNGEAYLVAHAGECTLIVGYQGYAKLFWQHPLARHLDAQAVHEHDEFDYAYGTDPYLKHKPALGDRGKVIAFYAVAALSTGARIFVVLSPDEVKALRGGKVGASGGIVDPMHWMDRKGLAVDTPVPTPTGWTVMGALNKGDTVFDMHGAPVRVLDTSPVKNIGCYRLTFGNGETVVCDEEHFWVARIGYKQSRTSWDMLSIAALYEAKQAGKPVTVPVAEPLETAPADLPVDPWMLGYWLGDGNRTKGSVSTHEDDVHDLRIGIETACYAVGSIRPDPRSKCVGMTVLGLSKQLADLGVLGHKHVPPTYLRGSVAQRRALLRGLMDSDGWIDEPRGRAYFGNTNEALTDAVAELARSLGEQVSRNVQVKTGFGKTVQSHVVMWQPAHCPFTLRRKVERFRPRSLPPYRGVLKIEQVESVPTRCIEVDSPTRTYLASRDMIPTHNTALRQLFKLLPKSPMLARALDADERTGTELRQADVITVPPAAIEPPVDTATGEVLDVQDPDEPAWPPVAQAGDAQ